MIGHAINELLMLGADAPTLARLFAAGEHRQQIVAALDERAGAVVGPGRHGCARLAAHTRPRQQLPLIDHPGRLIDGAMTSHSRCYCSAWERGVGYEPIRYAAKRRCS